MAWAPGIQVLIFYSTQIIYTVHSTGTISLFSDLYGLQVLLFMPSKFRF